MKMKQIALKAIEVVQSRLDFLAGTWVASYDDEVLGLFLMTDDELKRGKQYEENGWSMFPGFMVGENSNGLFEVRKSCEFYFSNRTVGGYAFSVSPGASFTVAKHFHEIKDSSGQEVKYHVDLGFILGIRQEETWRELEIRLSELVEYGSKVWENIKGFKEDMGLK